VKESSAKDRSIRFQVRAASPYLESSEKITIYNTLGGKKEEFLPLDSKSSPPTVKMYVCGLTPYDVAHMGHIVPALRFDLVRNYLEYRNLKVNFVQNVTDIDDKIINRVLETKEDPRELTSRVTESFYADMRSMHVRMPDYIVKVSESLPQIITYIDDLIKKGSAYASAEGNVYFDVAKSQEYGKLSNQRISELQEGVRIESEKDKRSPLDFALWKRDEKSSLSVASPWGIGRPGWHIECSVMIDFTLGTPIDIHGGGLDLKFPHHENEIAQSEAHDSHDFAKCWIHAGLLTIDGSKMSKSLGNFLSIETAFKQYGKELIRYVFLTHHYRSSVNLSDQIFLENINSLWDFYRTLALSEEKIGTPVGALDFSIASVQELKLGIEKALDDDFNTPLSIVALRKGLSHLRQLLSKPLEGATKNEAAQLTLAIREYGSILGLFHFSVEEMFDQGLQFLSYLMKKPIPPRAELEDTLKRRDKVRSEKNFAEADQIRNSLSSFGLEYLDAKTAQEKSEKLFLNLRFVGPR